jgi:hypothetical protein
MGKLRKATIELLRTRPELASELLPLLRSAGRVVTAEDLDTLGREFSNDLMDAGDTYDVYKGDSTEASSSMPSWRPRSSRRQGGVRS